MKKGKKGSVLYIELSPSGNYYTINSGGIFKNSYIEKRKKLWSASTEHSTTSGQSQDFPLAQHTPESDNVSALSQSPSAAKVGNKTGSGVNKQEKVGERQPFKVEHHKWGDLALYKVESEKDGVKYTMIRGERNLCLTPTSLFLKAIMYHRIVVLTRMLNQWVLETSDLSMTSSRVSPRKRLRSYQKIRQATFLMFSIVMTLGDRFGLG